MNVGLGLANITCEFESIDQADLSIGRLTKETGGVRGITVRRRQIPVGSHKRILAAVNPETDNSPAYLMAANSPSLFSVLQEPESRTEPEEIRSVTAEITCNRKNAKDVASRLTSLGATHIHIR